jgi:hypothetical protein
VLLLLLDFLTPVLTLVLVLALALALVTGLVLSSAASATVHNCGPIRLHQDQDQACSAFSGTAAQGARVTEEQGKGEAGCHE